MLDTVFLRFQLPNAATWFYFSLLLTVALFLQFARLFSLRNWDLLALFLFVPGFLLLQDAAEATEHARPVRRAGYIWLLSASGFWLVRCFVDLAVVRRPAFRSNLTTPGLIWFMVALFACVSAVAVRRPTVPNDTVGKPSAAIAGVKEGATAMVASASPPADPRAAAEVRVWVERGLAMGGHLAVVLGLFFVGWRHFRELETGVAMGTLYLLLPYTSYHIGQLHHVLPAALAVWAVFAYRHPRISGWLLGLAAGGAFFPALLFPIWLRLYWGRGAGAFAVRFALAAALGLVVALLVLSTAGGLPGGIGPALHAADWQPWKVPTAESVWQDVHWAYRLPVFVVYAVLVLVSFFWPPVRTMGHVAALSAAVLIGIQFWYADRGGLYVLWYTPLLLVIVFRPTATDLEPPPLGPGSGWGARLMSAAWGRVARRPPQPQPALAA